MEKIKLIGNRFICNIAQPENSPGGVLVLNRDPRKGRLKPDAYVGVVEEVGPGCRFLEVGKKIVVRRWIYSQHDLDDERIIAREHQILMLGDRTPYPGVVVMRIFDQLPKTEIIIPDTIKDKKKRTLNYHGVVIESGSKQFNKDEILWVEKRDSGQYFLGKNILVFKNERDRMNGDYPVLMMGMRVPELSVI